MNHILLPTPSVVGVIEKLFGESAASKLRAQFAGSSQVALITDSRNVNPRQATLLFLRNQNLDHRRTARVSSLVAIIGPNSQDDIQVPESNLALWDIWSACGGAQVAESVKAIGVTGTNGKTTVTWMLRSILSTLGLKSALLGTVEWLIGEEVVSSSHTTPDLVSFINVLERCHQLGIGCLVMEVSSHALDQCRLGRFQFDVTGFTNLSRDHLDYHGTMERYLGAKARLFLEQTKTMSVVCHENSYSADLLELLAGHPTPVKKLETQVGRRVGSVQILSCDAEGWLLSFQGAKHRLPMLGWHNVSNWALALGLAECWGLTEKLDWARIGWDLPPGRLQKVIVPGNGSVVLIDYAHTPDGVTTVVQAVRKHFDGWALGVVFGCGGDRDPGKRPLMGQAAGQFSTKVWITNDNPRSEDPLTIARQAQQGVPEGVIVLDRGEAIKAACHWAAQHHARVVLVLGKGHEQFQQIGEQKFAFSDLNWVQKMLSSLS